MTVVRCVEVSLTIPDNEARTALTTLRRLGVAVTALERADVYRCEVQEREADRLSVLFRSVETLFNPNKHSLRVRTGEGPEPGEVWIAERLAAPERESTAGVRIAGRTLPGVTGLERFTSWRLIGDLGAPAESNLVQAAQETLLCNPAFQKAMTA
jgi:phosphoribosylformylglycinamidine (FGAM) synthase PurS component